MSRESQCHTFDDFSADGQLRSPANQKQDWFEINCVGEPVSGNLPYYSVMYF